jgi:hypothetical protein
MNTDNGSKPENNLAAKKMQDILPLYIGGRCKTENGKVGFFSNFDVCQRDYSIVMITVRYSDNPDDWDLFNNNEECDRIKLLLTPISHITEDELVDIWALIGGAPHLCYVEEIKDWICNGNTIDGLVLGALEMALITNFLIKKGYDIFYLIESKQAAQLHESDII